MATEYTDHTKETLDEAIATTGLDLKVRYWNNQYHVLIGERHIFCGEEYECQAYLQGASCLIREMNKSK